MREALALAGVHEPVFEYEPIAAAYAYQQRLTEPATVLIGDFGGGTSDFSLLALEPRQTCLAPASPSSATMVSPLRATRSTAPSCATRLRCNLARLGVHLAARQAPPNARVGLPAARTLAPSVVSQVGRNARHAAPHSAHVDRSARRCRPALSGGRRSRVRAARTGEHDEGDAVLSARSRVAVRPGTVRDSVARHARSSSIGCGSICTPSSAVSISCSSEAAYAKTPCGPCF